MSTLIIIEDHRGNRGYTLVTEYFATDGDALRRARELLQHEDMRQLSALLTLRIVHADGSMMDDATVRGLVRERGA